jgi:single-strand DNA-binding protein
MERGLNKLLLIGYVERDPEMRYTPTGRPVTSFTVGTTYTWVSAKGERHEETEWFNVVAWDVLAEVCKNQLARNYLVFVEGRIRTRNWEDENGKRHSRAEVVAHRIIPLNDRRSTSEVDFPVDGDADDYAF